MAQPLLRVWHSLCLGYDIDITKILTFNNHNRCLVIDYKQA
jgi:hypothetical protein